MDICDFIPYYSDQDDAIFQTEVSNKMEYQRFASYPEEEIPEEGKLFNHQSLFERFIRFNDQAMIMSDMGTGKTLQFVSPSEYYRHDKHKRPMTPEKLYDERIEGNIRGILIIVKNDSLRANIEDSIWKFGFKDVDLTLKKLKKTTSKEKQISSERMKKTKIIAKFYKVMNYQGLANDLAKLTDEAIQDLYDDHIIIFDEIHNIKLDSNEYKKSREGKRKVMDMDLEKVSTDVNKEITRLYTVTRGCKYIIASATPMINNANEIFSIFNLIVPDDRRINKVDDAGQVRNVRKISQMSDDELKDYFRGRISYVARLDNGVDAEMQGEKIGDVIIDNLNPAKIDTFRELNPKVINEDKNLIQVYSNIIVYKTYMSDYQTDVYNLTEDQAFRIEERHTAMFVYPGNPSDFLITRIQNRKLDVPLLQPKLKEHIKQYGKYLSCKYDEISRLCDEESGKSFCYMEYVERGTEILAEYFNNRQFKRLNPNEELLVRLPDGKMVINIEKDKRYAVLDGTLDKNQLANILALVNHPDNLFGEYCKVILGTRVARDGINLMEFMAMHIVDGGWTDAGREQAMMRVIRAVSHVNQLRLLRAVEGPNARFKVKVYRHCAIPRRPSPKYSFNLEEQAKYYNVNIEGRSREDSEAIILQAIKDRVKEANEEYISNRLDLEELYNSKTELEKYNNSYYGGVDVSAYIAGEYKTKTIKRVERIMKEQAIDAIIHWDRNKKANELNGVKKPRLYYELDKYDESTYNIIDPNDCVDNLLNNMVSYFSRSSTLSREEIIQNIKDTIPSESIPIPTIDIIADRAKNSIVPMLDYTGYPVKLNYEQGIFYRSIRDMTYQKKHEVLYPTSEYIDIVTTTKYKDIQEATDDFIYQTDYKKIRRIEKLLNQMTIQDYNIREMLRETSGDINVNIVNTIESIIMSFNAITIERLLEQSIMMLYYEKNKEIGLKWLQLELRNSKYQISLPFAEYFAQRFNGHWYKFREPTKEIQSAIRDLKKNQDKIKTVRDLKLKRERVKISYDSIIQDGPEVYVHMATMIGDPIDPYNIENIFNAMSYQYRIFKPSAEKSFVNATFAEIKAYNKLLQILTSNTYSEIMSKPIYGVFMTDKKFRIMDPFKVTNEHTERSKQCQIFRHPRRVRMVKLIWEEIPEARNDLLNIRILSEKEKQAKIKLIRAALNETVVQVKGGKRKGKDELTDDAKEYRTFIRDEDLEDEALIQLLSLFISMEKNDICSIMLSLFRKHELLIDQFILPTIGEEI